MDNELNEEDISELITHTKSLINHVYWFKQDFNINPTKEHIGTAIAYTDIKERKDDFLDELVNTVAAWVYSKSECKKIIDDRMDVVSGDMANASSFLTNQAFSKFRPSHPQGQFGELLLFNFIQHFFGAVPLLRKQRITTSVGHERFGADAIHYKVDNQKNIFILGESKCYKSKYKFKEAFEKSLTSIETTFDNLDKELNLYTYDSFIEPELENIVKMYKSNTLPNVNFELVCLIAYNETKNLDGANEEEIKESIKSIIKERCCALDHSCFDEINTKILAKINYVIFPIWKLDDLLENFQKNVGSE
ncbi:DUF1837 domain-containing protein [Methanococcoides sp. SA1]|nr:DUF1837 domain-containing protein [Methanococcoides sp. SA1]